jgi:predicted component of type VI protein secretion system
MTNLLQENKEVESSPRKLHIWFFADTQTNPEKTKRAIFINAQSLNVSLDFKN